MNTSQFLSRHPQDFVRFLQEEGIGRLCFVNDFERGRLLSSHPQLQAIADFIQSDRRDFLGHEGLFFQISKRYETLQGAFVHRTNRGQAAGGVRYWHYDTLEAYLRDGLRLAVGMTFKNALAGIWWGGGKGVMSWNPRVDLNDPGIRASLYSEYGELMSSIRGCYVTAEDAGTSVNDMAHVFSKTRFTTCIPPELGGSGNPSIPTARGVICGMEAALDFLERPGLEGKTVAVQGMGHVGEPLTRFLLDKKVASIVASDIDPNLVRRLVDGIGDPRLEATVVPEGDDRIFRVECDIFSPCATGAILNPQTIQQLKAKIVCGAANNQLEDHDRDDRDLYDRGILYVPDFLTNRMGIVNCADEQAGRISRDSLIERHLSKDWEYSIHQMCLKVLKASESKGEPPSKVAIQIADQLSLECHPIFGHRGREIISSLVADRWHEA